MKFLISESSNFSEAARQELEQALGAEFILAQLDTREALLHKMEEVNPDVLWVRLKHFIGQDILAAAPRLRCIATATTGLTHLDLPACEARGIEIVSLKGETSFLKDIRATSEHTLLLMLSLLRRAPMAVRDVLEGGWNRETFRGGELSGATVGLIGYGRIGTQVAELLNTFRSRILVHDRTPPSEPVTGIEFVPLEELLAQSDIVSIHASYQPGTPPILGQEEFRQMRTGTLLVNTARGELLDEQCLRDALLSGKVAGAALDVLSGEPVLDLHHHPLVEMALKGHNVIITPHLGGATWDSMRRTEDFVAKKLIELIEVNPKFCSLRR